LPDMYYFSDFRYFENIYKTYLVTAKKIFALLIELAKEYHYGEEWLNASLDSEVGLEISVGKCWWNYARSVLHMQDSQRHHYQHLCPNGRPCKAWAYPIHYLPAFRRWLREVYFVEKFPAYQRYRAKRIGTQVEQISAKAVRTQLRAARGGMTQLPLFSEAIA